MVRHRAFCPPRAQGAGAGTDARRPAEPGTEHRGSLFRGQSRFSNLIAPLRRYTTRHTTPDRYYGRYLSFQWLAHSASTPLSPVSLSPVP